MIDSGLKLPLSKAAATVNGLKVEPGSKTSVTALFLSNSAFLRLRLFGSADG